MGLENVWKFTSVSNLVQVEDFLGTAMTYSLFEWVKENYDDLVADQPETAPVVAVKVVNYFYFSSTTVI